VLILIASGNEKAMKKKAWSSSCSLRAKTKALIKDKRRLKKIRAKRARRNPDDYRKTGAWDII
jgi:hypothetical protein